MSASPSRLLTLLLGARSLRLRVRRVRDGTWHRGQGEPADPRADIQLAGVASRGSSCRAAPGLHAGAVGAGGGTRKALSLVFHDFFTGIQLGVNTMGLTVGMSSETLIRPVAEGHTEKIDPVACLDERVRREAPERPETPGRYLEVQGPERTVVIALRGEVLHIGRGLAADLHLDESSVSRRHAIVVPRPSGTRILDDRSSNGTFVNGRRVQQAELQHGDVIVLGRVVLRYLEV
jgi:hypothetical protein